MPKMSSKSCWQNLQRGRVGLGNDAAFGQVTVCNMNTRVSIYSSSCRIKIKYMIMSVVETFDYGPRKQSHTWAQLLQIMMIACIGLSPLALSILTVHLLLHVSECAGSAVPALRAH